MSGAKWLGALAATIVALTSACPQAAVAEETEFLPGTADVPPAEFVIADIRVEGLQRITEGTIYNYLPVNIGDRLDQRRIQEAIRALFATGFFRDIEIRRDGSTLIVVVAERPSIESFEISGNKDIKTEDLQKSLRSVGLASGKTFDRSVLEEVEAYLTDQYFSRGKYAVRIEPTVEEVPGNRVKIRIDVQEGKRARIRKINVVGNEVFEDETLLGEFALRTPGWLSWYKQDDRYSRESLQSDLETIESYYQDRGYANFEVESTQVALAPELDDIFITINVREGETYKVGEVKIAGQMKVPESELRRLLLVSPGRTWSRKAITQTQELLAHRLGLDGYAFAKVDPVPTTNEETKTVDLTFYVDPGSRAYVRRINFLNTSSINDEVLRREMRQHEGAYLSNALLERSKERLQRLPYIKKAEYETTPVPGTPDLVDVDFEIEEGLPGQFSGGIGYSASQSFLLTGSFVHSNLMGSGKRVALDLNGGQYSQLYSLSHTDPYLTIDGISRTVNLAYQQVQQLTSDASDFSTTSWSTGIELGYPITETQFFQAGMRLQRYEFATSIYSSDQVKEWVRENGDSFFDRVGSSLVLGTQFDTLELSAGWLNDSRDRVLFPTRGTRHRVTLAATAPVGDVNYLTANYDYEQYLKLPWVPFVTLRTHFRAAYAQALGGTTDTPPNRLFYLGGPDSVRGFKESTLGPRDSLGNPYGGDLLVAGQLEAILPVPAKWASTTRFVVFYDFGQLASVGNTEFRDKQGSLTEYPFEWDGFSASAGVAVEWLAPLGLFRFSLGMPLRKRVETRAQFGDDVEQFQFSIGRAF
jgi:outer membrane protein insertion porin family